MRNGSAAAPPDADADRKSGMRSLTKLLPYAKPFWKQFLVVLGLVVIYNGTSVVQPLLVKIAIDRDISGPHTDAHGLLTISFFYVGIVLLGLIANITQILVLQFAGQGIIRKIRIDLFAHIERQGMEFFDRHAVGRLVTNVSSDTETVSQFFTNFFLSLIRDGLSLMMIIVTMFLLNVRIASYCMILIPIIVLISLLFRTKLRVAYQTTRTRLSNVVAFLAENLAGMRITQIFHQEARQRNRYEELNRAHRNANVHEYFVSMTFNRVLGLLGDLAVAYIVWVGGGDVVDKVILFGTLYAFISYVRQFFQPINSITQNWNTLQASMVSADRLGRILSVQPTIKDPPIPSELPPTIQGRIEFVDVSFAYKPDEPVLRNISFVAEPGSLIGFVGATGAGKSSVMSLLARFYDPQSGSITLDGIDIRSVRQKDLHRVVGLVQQDLHLFAGTVADNIRLFRTDISHAAVVEAAQVVGAHDLIASLPQGYETRLYAKGANLSMGERQLIAFARIVALNPRILILDEATASLDSKTEELVQAGLARVSQSRTTLVIAHRLSTIRNADRIIVMERGQIVESGTHDELLQAAGYYATLHASSSVSTDGRTASARSRRALPERRLPTGSSGRVAATLSEPR
jgi:ATP-binding cassette subfamily B multidrug efflux pump